MKSSKEGFALSFQKASARKIPGGSLKPRVSCRSLLVLFSVLLMFSCTACTSSEQAPIPSYVSPYNWSNLSFEEGRYYYYKDALLMSKTGVDVSDHQEVIEWDLVAADGIDFAMIRLGNRGYTEGDVYLDEQYYANIEGASAAGLEVGVYFFSQAINEEEAREEADFVLENLAGRRLDYPVVYDHEPVADQSGRANRLSREQLTINTLAFCERIEAAGYSAMIYGNKRDIARLNLESLTQHPIWFAEYDAEIPSGQFDFIMWQYTSTASVAGISTSVDLNIHFLAA